MTGRQLWLEEKRQVINAQVSDFTRYQTVVKELWDGLDVDMRREYTERAAGLPLDVARCIPSPLFPLFYSNLICL